MAWTYSDWRSQSTTAAQITRLKLHMTEVSDAFGPSVSGADMSVDRAEVRQYLKDLKDELAELEASPSACTNGGLSYVRVRDA